LIHLLNDSHNEFGDVGTVWTASLGTWLTAAKARNADARFVVLGQNPRVPSYGYPERQHRSRLATLPGWAAANNVRYIDTGRPFYNADGSVNTALINSDLTHPTLVGAGLQADQIMRELIYP
jgi:hypothetical protein